MKSHAIRAFVLLALIAVAHQIKPFTSTNVIAFAGASARSLTDLRSLTGLHSLTDWLPESALRKASVLAAVVGRAWQKNDALALPAANNLLSVNKTTDAPACECKTKRRVRTAAALPVRVAAVPEIEGEETEIADEPVISWQNDATEEAPASEKMELPRSTELPHTAAAPAWSTIMPKRDACEIPDSAESAVTSTIETLPEAKPMNESEIETQTKTIRSGRPVRSSEMEPVEIQPIVFPRASAMPSRLLYLRVKPASASKC